MSAGRKPLSTIGEELIQAAEAEESELLPLSSKLFPYFYVASRRMSLRSISGWLEKNHGVSLSPASISKALRNPKVHLRRLGEHFSAQARYVATYYEGNPTWLLCSDEKDQCRIWDVAGMNKDPLDESHMDVWGALQDLSDTWAGIPREVRLKIEPYIGDEEDDEPFPDPDEHDEEP